MSIRMRTKRVTKLENGTGEDITVNLVSDGFKIKLSDLEPEGVYPITTDIEASRMVYVIALAGQRVCDPMVITSDDLAENAKVTIYVDTITELVWHTEGRARETDDSASPTRPTPNRMETYVENCTEEDIEISKLGGGAAKTKLGDVKHGDFLTITPDVTANYDIALAGRRTKCDPVVIPGENLAEISKVTISINHTGKLVWSNPESKREGFLKRIIRTVKGDPGKSGEPAIVADEVPGESAPSGPKPSALADDPIGHHIVVPLS